MTGRRPLVIGLAGGIGSGKSLAGAMLAELGCVVIDSDREARAALERPEVRDALAGWWGPSVLDAEGNVDRSRVAAIVFADAAQRRRLEALVHPLVRRAREEFVERAAEAGALAVIVDAPLLFEAGVNKECDAVIFIDAPIAARLERVRTTRGWGAEELERRERAQWPLEKKRRLADHVVANDAGPEGLRVRMAAVLRELLATRAGR